MKIVLQNLKKINIFFVKKEGFTFIETLVSIFIVLLLTAAVAFLFTTVIKNTDKFYDNSSAAITIIKTDSLLRNSIRNTVIPYYENGENIARTKASDIMVSNITGVELKDYQILHSKNGKARGICIRWKLEKGDEYQTVALFSSIPLNE